MFRLAVVISFNVALALEVTPVEKVSKMLTDLRTQVNEEGAAEAKTYNTFACFCKDTMAAKSKAITEGKGEKNTLASRINADSVTRDGEDVKIGDKTKEIGTLDEELKKAHTDRREERLTYEKNEMDLTGAVRALESAILALKAAKTGVGLAQLPADVQQGLIMAQALMPESKASRSVAAFISESDPNDAYAFQSGDVITTLEGLKTDFKAKKNELGEADVKAKAAYDLLVQNKQQAVKDATAAVETAKKDKADASVRIATSSTDLTTTSAQLLDDQTYMEGLAKNCNQKAVLWDKRTTQRASELSALTTAIDLIKDLPKKNNSAAASSAAAASFVQLAQESQRALPAVARTAPAALHQQQAPVPAKKQSLAAAVVKTSLGGKRARVMAMLRASAQNLKSAELTNLLAAAAADPFAKVKTLIQELIERLLAQAASEASHKGFCDKEYAMTTLKRDNAANTITEMNGLLELSEARIAKLGEEITDLTTGIAAIEASQNTSTQMRTKNKKENEDAIKTAEEGKKTVEQAIKILEEYYKTAAKNEAASASFLQVSAEPESPDAGFDGEYAGSQDGSVGVLGMLDVVKSDFERTIKETQKDEDEAVADQLELETSTGVSKATKEEGLKARTTAKSEADADDAKNRASLTSNQDILDKTIAEIAALDKACMLGGQTATERKIQRDEEMDALKSALCILDSNGGDTSSCV